MLPIIFIMPIVQLLVLVYAANLDMKNIQMYVVDKDISPLSRALVSKFEGSPFFQVNYCSFSLQDANEKLIENKADIVLNIPHGFERVLYRENTAELQLLINAINVTTASITNAYAMNVIGGFNQQILVENINVVPFHRPKTLDVSYSFWYNPEMDYKIYMLPGILVILVTIIGMFLTALNLVREKEMGTIEQINVTPIRKYQFITGKLIPFWIIALVELSFGLLVGKLLFNIPLEGSLLLLFGFASIYLLVGLGIGLFLSTISSTQQQVMFIMFFIFLTFVMMSGIFTPAESMPDWAQVFNHINPLAYFMKVIRMILLKGSGFADIKKEFFSLVLFAIIALSLAIWRYRKVS